MGPQGNDLADLAILEGNEFIDRGVVKNGMGLLSSGKVKRLIVVLHLIAPSHRRCWPTFPLKTSASLMHLWKK